MWDIGLEYPEKQLSTDPDLVVHVFPRGSKYAVAVELQRVPDATPVVSGIAVRSAHLLSGDEDPGLLTPRDVQRLPLSRIVRAALAAEAKAPRDFAELNDQRPTTRPGAQWLRIRNRPDVLYYDHGGGSTLPDAPVVEAARGKLTIPRGKPRRDEPAKSTKFYMDILAAHSGLVEQGQASPVKEIARRKGVPANRVHQWLYRARRLASAHPSDSTHSKEGETDAS